MGQSAGKIARPSPSSCPGPNNLPPLQFHSVHGDNIRISRDGTLARRFESFCRAITFSARPVRINERICVKFAEISHNWNGGIRFGFTSNDPATLENALPKYACPDLTNRSGFWAKALHEAYSQKDNTLYYYVNSAGDVIYGINNEEKGVILTGVDTRGLLWTLIDIYGNCTAIEFLDARIYMYQQHPGSRNSSVPHELACRQICTLNSIDPLQQIRRSLPGVNSVDQELERHVMPSMQSLNIDDSLAIVSDLINELVPLTHNIRGHPIPVPFHTTKGRNVRLSQNRFIATRTANEFCQGYVFTPLPIVIGMQMIVQILKTDQIFLGGLGLGLTSCNPATLQPSDLPNDSDFLLDRPEYWVVSKDIASKPQRCDEIAFVVTPNGEVIMSKNKEPPVVILHVDQSLQLWAFLDIYGSTQSVRMYRQRLPDMGEYQQQQQQQQQQQLQLTDVTTSSSRVLNMNGSESRDMINGLIIETRKLKHPKHNSTISISSSSTLGSISNSNANLMNGGATTAAVATTSNGALNILPTTSNTALNTANINSTGSGSICTPSAVATTSTTTTTNRVINVPSNGDMIQIQPSNGNTVLVVNLPPTSSPHAAHDISSVLGTNQARLNQLPAADVLSGACSATSIRSNTCAQYIEPINGTSTISNNVNKWKDSVDHSSSNKDVNSSAECTICYERQIDSVLYTCGHMCMCYDCALEQWRGVGGGHCPLCRAYIRDVIRTYTT